jgi:4-alpha-glucanotransferase
VPLVFAGNELLISPDALIEDGLLQAVDCGHRVFSPSVVEYEKVVPFKVRLVETAWSRFSAGARPDLLPAYEEFRQAQGSWLDDYALFRALKARYNGGCYLNWPVDLVRRTPAALAHARERWQSRSSSFASRSSCSHARRDVSSNTRMTGACN